MIFGLNFEVGFDHDSPTSYVEDPLACAHPLWGKRLAGWKFEADELQDATYQACVKAALEGLSPCLIKPITRYQFSAYCENGWVDKLVMLDKHQSRAVWKQLVKEGWIHE